jgi:hypothetical protein
LREIFLYVKNTVCYALTTVVDEEYGFTKEQEKLQQKKKLRKKPKSKGKK